MKAIALTALGRLEPIEIPQPVIQTAADVLLKIERVGVCGSDLHYFETGRIGPRVAAFPFVLGHECSATVAETGRNVKRVRVGDRVAVDPAISCHQCDQCRSGRPHTCRKLRFLGCPGERDGCLSEFLVLPEDCLYPLPDTVTLDQAVLCEPFSIGLYAVQRCGLVRGETAVILGTGPIGLCVLLAARQKSVTTIGMTDRIPRRVALAREAGATWAGNPDVMDVVKVLLQENPSGADVVYECAGQQATLDQAVELAKPGGRIALIGIPRTDHVSFKIDHLRRKEITLINVRRQNECVQTALNLVAAGTVNLDFLATHRFHSEQAQQAFELVASYRDGVIKALIDFAAGP